MQGLRHGIKYVPISIPRTYFCINFDCNYI